MKALKSILWVIAFVAVSFNTYAEEVSDYQKIITLKNQIIDIQNKGDLGVSNLTFCSKIIGFGAYVPLEKNIVAQNNEILVYYEPLNLFTNRVKGSYELFYSQDLILLSENGEVIFGKEKALQFHYYSMTPVLDVYATNNFNVGNIPPGKYIYKMVLNDELRGTKSEKTIDLEIVQ